MEQNPLLAQLGQLPPEFQAQIQDLLRKRQMAMAMQQQAQQQQPQQYSPGPYAHAVKTSPFEHLAKGVGAFLGSKKEEDATKGLADVQSQAQGKISSEIARIQAMPVKEAIAAARAHPFPQVQAIGKALADQMWKSAELTSQALSKGGFHQDAVNTAQGQVPPAQLPPKTEPYALYLLDAKGQPVLDAQGQKIPAVREVDKDGNVTLKPLRSGTNVAVNLPGEEGKHALQQQTARLKDLQTGAEGAVRGLGYNRIALDALNEGAKVGGLGGFKQSMRKLAQGFGIQSDDNTSTEALTMSLGNAVLDRARTLAPVTAEDVKRLQEILGSVNTDPMALVKFLEEYNAIYMNKIQTLHQYVDAQSGPNTNPETKRLHQNQAIGFPMPTEVAGTATQGIRTLQKARQHGMDLSNWTFRPSQGKDGVPGLSAKEIEEIGKTPGGMFPPGTEFNLSGSGIPPPAQKPRPQTQGQKPVSAMTPEEKAAEIAELKKRLGMQ